MATKQPRLNIVLEPQVYQFILRLSKKENLSMSLLARDLLKEALTLYEDSFWAKEAGLRERNFQRSNALKHSDVWK